MGIVGFPKYREYRDFLIAQMVRNLSPMLETWVQSLGLQGFSRKNPLEKEIETHSYILAWRIP